MLLGIVGLLTVIFVIVSLARILFSASVSKLKTARGKWAVVTGASDGIGYEFAAQLAAFGFNVVLISRSKDKLDRAAKEIAAIAPNVETKVIAFDFTANDQELYLALFSELRSLDIGVLVNNVAISHACPINWIEEDESVIENILQVNIHSLLKITREVVTSMIRKKGGFILNVGSMAGMIPSPLLSTYAASKAFLKSFSLGLSYELASANIHVQHINTFFVATAMSKIRKTSWMTPSPHDFVKSVLKQAGSSYDCTPYFSHAILEWVLGWIPESVLIKQSYKMHVDIRKRAIKKRERIAQESKKK